MPALYYDAGIKLILMRYLRRYPSNPKRHFGGSVRDHISRKQAWGWVRRIGGEGKTT